MNVGYEYADLRYIMPIYYSSLALVKPCYYNSGRSVSSFRVKAGRISGTEWYVGTEWHRPYPASD